MNTNATLLLGVALAGILVVATLDSDTKPQAPEKEDKPKVEPKKVVL